MAAQAITLVERSADVMGSLPNTLAPRPNVILLHEMEHETTEEFELRVVRRVARAVKEGPVEQAHYFAGPDEGRDRLMARGVIARALLRALASSNDHDSRLTFFAPRDVNVQRELFALVDSLRAQAGSSFNSHLAFPSGGHSGDDTPNAVAAADAA